MTSYGPLSDLHTIVERQYNEELYFNQIGGLGEELVSRKSLPTDDGLDMITIKM